MCRYTVIFWSCSRLRWVDSCSEILHVLSHVSYQLWLYFGWKCMHYYFYSFMVSLLSSTDKWEKTTSELSKKLILPQLFCLNFTYSCNIILGTHVSNISCKTRHICDFLHVIMNIYEPNHHDFYTWFLNLHVGKQHTPRTTSLWYWLCFRYTHWVSVNNPTVDWPCYKVHWPQTVCFFSQEAIYISVWNEWGMKEDG